MIIGIGVDLVGVARISRVYQRHPRRFSERVYVPEEMAYCLQAADPSERLAARWAAKEACMKALGTGWADGVTFTDIALIAREPRGAPHLQLSGRALAVATQLGASAWHCSVSHSDGFAVATVILEAH